MAEFQENILLFNLYSQLLPLLIVIVLPPHRLVLTLTPALRTRGPR